MANLKKMFVSDFDGTLADNKSCVSAKTRDSLIKLEELNIVRVLATGRSLFSLNTVVEPNFPIDYLVFSSGIGIYDWKNKILLQHNEIEHDKTVEIYDFLVKNNYDFMVQLPVPNNHFFHHFTAGNPGDDFLSRIRYYESHGVDAIIDCPQTASQFVVICSEEANHLSLIKETFPCVKVLKATSPLDRKSVWVEILPFGISKASGIEYLRQKLNVNLADIVTVGNDYYDLDMLRYSLPENSFVVSNAPEDVLEEFQSIKSNTEDGVAELIEEVYFGKR
jgi:HAD superfamily hydrolase (TIGR01484 family)